jgi:lysine 2,3-aminomutase
MELWKDVSPEEWNDWRWQIRNRITTLEQLEQIITLDDEEKAGIRKCLTMFRMAISPYYWV